ncbi:MAG: LptF/LptG family permease [Spirochaetaceae bacterium]|nr:LptF/LptG family permease [Spirochaetaceae bacterium]
MRFFSYLMRRFLPVFLGAMFFFSLILVLVDLLMNLWSFISQQVPFVQVMYVMLLYIPKTLSFSLPLSILFAVCYVLSDFYAKNELTAVFASGVSLFRFTLPLLVFSLFLSFGLFIFEDRIVVPTYAKKISLQNQLLNKNQSLNNDQIVIISSGGSVVYNADFYSDEDQTLKRMFVILRNEDKSLNTVVRAITAVWNGNNWDVTEGTQYVLKDQGLVSSPVSQETMALLTEPPETFRNNTVAVDTVSVQEAKSYISRLKRSGLPTAEALSEYYKKYSFPLVVFIVVFLSIGLSGKTRKNVLLISLVLCVGAAVLFYVTQMVTMLLAKFGYISPLLGAWFPVIMFIPLSVVLLKFART